MTGPRHYARTIDFDQLTALLQAAREQRLVYARSHGPLQLWCYTSKAVYDRVWTPATLVARGLVLDTERRTVVATPFPKFFNVGEMGQAAPDEPCDVYEKVDGSLIVIFHDGARWRTATKGALDSAQALWAQARLDALDLSALTPGATYLAEALYAENRIVVRYDETGLVLLAAYDAEGFELGAPDLAAVAGRLGWRMARRQPFCSVAEAMAHCDGLPQDEEGYVLRFAGGLRLKAKGAAYRRVHALLSRITPLGLWDALWAGDDMGEMRRRIPEEFWSDFDDIHRLLQRALDEKLQAIAQAAAQVAHLSDKDLGLQLGNLPKDVAGFLFSYRRNPDLPGDPRARTKLMNDLRPQANVLPGYVPSYAVQRFVADE